MKAKMPLIGGLLLIIFLWSIEAAASPRNPVPGQAVIKLATYGRPESIARWAGANLKDSIPGRQTFLVQMRGRISVDSLISRLAKLPGVQFAEPNYELQLPETYQMSISFPDDNAPPLLNGVEPASFFAQSATYSLGIDSAQLTATGRGITVAVIDNGFDFTHPLLAPRLLAGGYDFVNNDGDPSCDTGAVFEHGTFVAGLIALTAPDCALLPLRAFDGNGVGTTFSAADAVYYAVSHGASIINMSFGTPSNSTVMSQACAAATAAGVHMVAASGNNSTSVPSYPAAYPGVIAVSGTDTLDLLASFSNYGDHIDICAPAVNLYSTLAGSSDWGTWSGTSFAAPFVSATCAMVLERNATYTVAAMENHIRSTAAVTLQWGTVIPPDPAYGYGRIDVANAVYSAGPAMVGSAGDANASGQIDLGDVIFIVKYLQRGGVPMFSTRMADVNCDGVVDKLDIEFLMNHIFKGGPPPGNCRVN
jgi:subtilisin family serine protease